MRQELSRDLINPIVENLDISSLPYDEIIRLYEKNAPEATSPEGVAQVDPRNREQILYSTARSSRPHDNLPDTLASKRADNNLEECVICRGQTTGVIDLTELSDGFTFINKNLFPILSPSAKGEASPQAPGVDSLPDHHGVPASGLHLLQWTSSIHETDWHNMPSVDLDLVMSRLATLERQLITTSQGSMPPTEAWGDQPGRSGFVSIIKNVGYLVGGSIAHGHQQIAFSNVMPRVKREHWRFEQNHSEAFASFMLRTNPAPLTLRDYGPAVLIVPYFMRRPYDMMLLLRDTTKRYLFELNSGEISAVSQGWHDGTRMIHQVMPDLGRELAYNVVAHNGPGAGLYFSFLPYTQETGGFEQLGLSISQGMPEEIAKKLRSLL
jgi:galactose-1-phosphate uridylyltransferase